MSVAPKPAWECRFRAPTVAFPTWSRRAPDHLVFASDQSGSWQVHTMDRGSGTGRRVTDNPVGVTFGTPTADGEGVVWFEDATGDESGLWMIAPFEGGDPRPFLPDIPEAWSGGLAIGHRIVAAAIADREGFAVYVSADGRPAGELHRHDELLQIAGAEAGGFNLAGLSADETLLCLEHAERGDSIHPALRVIDPRTGDMVGEQWDGVGLGLRAAAWSPVPGDQRLAIVHERQDFARPAIWDLATGERRDLAVDLPGDVDVYDWWPDAAALLLVQLHEGRDRLLRLDLASGALRSVPHPPGSISEARVRPDGQVWFRASSGEKAARVLSEGGEEVVVPEGERAPDGRPFRSWSFTNPKGQRAHGFVVTPPGEGPFPLVMWVHGGPTWLYKDHWNPDVQALVDQGFAVGMVNYRGSTGYGATWRDAIIGNIGFPEVEDVVAGLDDLIAGGVADPDRVAIGGYSWGGYITLLALGLHPDRWAAGVAGVPVGDYFASYEDSSPALQAYDRALLGGSVYEVPDLVRERSPITHVDRVRAAALVLVGENDTRCPVRQAMNYVEALRARGSEVELYRYDTGHSSFVVDEEVRQARVFLEFLRKHVVAGIESLTGGGDPEAARY